MVWSVEHTDEFAEWYLGLSEAQQDDITATATAVNRTGTATTLSLFVRDQRIEARAYARIARAKQRATAAGILRLRSPAVGDLADWWRQDGRRSLRFYERMVPIADGLYDIYIAEIRREGLIP